MFSYFIRNDFFRTRVVSLSKASCSKVATTSEIFTLAKLCTDFSRANIWSFRCRRTINVHTPVARGASFFCLIRDSRYWALQRSLNSGELTARPRIRTSNLSILRSSILTTQPPHHLSSRKVGKYDNYDWICKMSCSVTFSQLIPRRRCGSPYPSKVTAAARAAPRRSYCSRPCRWWNVSSFTFCNTTGNVHSFSLRQPVKLTLLFLDFELLEFLFVCLFVCGHCCCCCRSWVTRQIRRAVSCWSVWQHI